MLKHLMVEIFNGCNYHCNMCTIWQNKGINIDAELLKKFLHSPYCEHMESIGITGGEPMMSGQLQRLADIVNERDNIKTVYVTSNGWFPDRLIDFIGMFPKKSVNVNISIDGMKETHNKIRGMEAFDRALGTLQKVIDSKIPKHIGIKMTVQVQNMHQMLDLYQLSRKFNVSFGIMPVVSTDAYFNNINNLDGIKINPGTPDGERFLKELHKLKRKMPTHYLDMLVEVYSGKSRNMDVYGCLFPDENNMIYADGKLGVCFMTGRRDVADYLKEFETFEKNNPGFRLERKQDLLDRDCPACPASCAANYTINFRRRVVNKVERVYSDVLGLL